MFLNKDDLFSEKIKHSNIKYGFLVRLTRITQTLPVDDLKDYEGQPGDVAAGREYFKKRFMRLSAKANRINEREIYTQYALVWLPMAFAVLILFKFYQCDGHRAAESSHGCS